jgi:hypothetical protein
VGVTVYQSPSVRAEINVQRQRLEAHQASPDNGWCVVCLVAAPCDEANEAANFLVERGLLTETQTTTSTTKDGRPGLLTHVWQRWFERP